MSTDQELFYGAEVGRMNSALTAPKTAIQQRFTRILRCRVAADAAANTNLSEQLLDLVTYKGQVTAAYLVAEVAVTSGNTTNYAVVTLQTRDDAGGSAATVGTVNCATSNLSAWVAKAFTLNTSNVSISALGKLTLKHDKTGAGGLSLPAYSVFALVKDV